MDDRRHKGKPLWSQKYLGGDMHSHWLQIQYPALTPSTESQMFQSVLVPSKFLSSHSLKIKAFLVAWDSWGLQQVMAGLLQEENHEGRRRITGNHWQGFQPAGQWRGRPQSNPALPTVCQSSPMPQSALYILYLYKNYVRFLIQGLFVLGIERSMETILEHCTLT